MKKEESMLKQFLSEIENATECGYKVSIESFDHSGIEGSINKAFVIGDWNYTDKNQLIIYDSEDNSCYSFIVNDILYDDIQKVWYDINDYKEFYFSII